MAWVYILTNRKFGTLYIGSTTNLIQRVWQHKNEVVPSFTKRHHLQGIYRAMQREKTMKHWKAEWKVALIENNNPEWDDLYWWIAPRLSASGQ